MTKSDDQKKRDSEVRDEMAKEYRRLHDRNDNPKVFHRLSYDNGWDDCKLHSPDVKALLDALEFECGNRCHPEHNPCNARQALDKWRKENK